MTIRTHEQLLEHLSLRTDARASAETIKDLLASLGYEDVCVGYHYRHVLDTSSPTVEIGSSDPTTAEGIRSGNERAGLHTLNHVLDSLFYSANGLGTSDSLVLAARLTYGMKQAESLHRFARAPEAGFGVWKAAGLAPYRKEHDELGSVLGDGLFGRFGVHWCKTEAVTTVSPTGLANTRLACVPGSETYNGYLCGAQEFCDAFRIPPSVPAYVAIIGAIGQLGTYVERFGSEIVTLMFRPAKPFDVTAGMTVISKRLVSTGHVAKLLEHLRIENRTLESTPLGKKLAARIGIGTDTRMKRHGSLPRVWRAASCTITGCSTLHSEPDDDKKHHLRFLTSSVESFLGLALSFCEERLEGRPLRYGLILGNPFLMANSPGQQPLPLTAKTGDFIFTTDLAKEVHLVTPARDRCLVLPYVDASIRDEAPFPVYVLELRDFVEALAEWRHGQLWVEDLRHYAFLTAHYPWSLAAIVGPGAEIRLFARGGLIAFRDGKGWRRRHDLDDLPLSSEEHRPILGALLDVGMQLSPMVREGSHGGLLVWVDKELNDETFWCSQGCGDPARAPTERPTRPALIQPLRDTEPWWPPGMNRAWLTGRALLDAPTEGRDRLNRETAQLVLRASMLDGAVVFCGREAVVKFFGRRLNHSSSEGGASGSKRATAPAFVKSMADQGIAAIAVAVSSDGPITVFTPGNGAKGEELYQRVAEE